MNNLTVLDFSVLDLNEMNVNDMALIDGGMTAYEAGRAAGAILQIAATIIAFL